jgi:very-short-patch-repair endonuclease
LQGDIVEVPLSPVVAEDSEWVETFAQAWLMGLELEYYVRPEEIRVFRRDWVESGRSRASLVFYDTMPGGTGYLKRMVQDVPRLAKRIVEHLETCPCERACYRCLKDYWNQRVHGLLDKRLVLQTFQALAAAAPGAERHPLDEAVRFDSFLEAQFYRLLSQEGLALPSTQKVIRDPLGRYIIRADFTYEREGLVVLTDGRAFHAQDPVKVVEDLDRRNALSLGGYRLLEFTYRDVVHDPQGVVELVRQALRGAAEGPGAQWIAGSQPPEEAWDFVRRLCQDVPAFRPGGHLRLADGTALSVLAAAPEWRWALVSVDVEGWGRDAAFWQRDLSACNRARLDGWQVLRVPQNRLRSPETQELIVRLAALVQHRGS